MPTILGKYDVELILCPRILRWLQHLITIPSKSTDVANLKWLQVYGYTQNGPISKIHNDNDNHVNHVNGYIRIVNI